MRRSDEQFMALLQQEQGKLLRIARAITGQEADAWDMVQEATLNAYDRFGQLHGGPEAFGPWIRRILVNCSRNLLRSRSRLLPLELVGEAVPDPEPGPQQRLDSSVLWGEVMSLEEHHRQVLALRFAVDLSVDELAALLDVPSGTVKSRLHRAVKALRQRLEADDNKAVRCR